MGRGLALTLLIAALANLCLSLKLAICLDDTYLGQGQLVLPLILLSFALWSAGCLLNRAVCGKVIRPA